MLIQELMIGKYEDVEIKNSCWARELANTSDYDSAIAELLELLVP